MGKVRFSIGFITFLLISLFVFLYFSTQYLKAGYKEVIWGITLILILVGNRFIMRVLHKYDKAEKEEEKPFKYLDITSNEIRDLKQEIHYLKQGIHYSAEFLKNIKEGKLNQEYLLSFESRLKEQNFLKENILHLRTQIAETRKIEEKRSWETKGLSLFDDVMRTNNDDLKELCNSVVRYLVRYIDACQGDMFLMNSNNKDKFLELTASYAYERKKRLDFKKVSINEGLIGQVVKDKKLLYMTDLPEEYIKINSGLGEASPSCIVIIPFVFDNEVLALAEIASFTPISQDYLNFLEKVSQNISITIFRVLRNVETRRLVNDLQHRTEQMHAQEEEMKQNLEALLNIQQKMDVKDAEMSGIINAINDIAYTAEFTLDGKIIKINDRFAKLICNSPNKCIDKHFGDFISERKNEKFWDKFRRGFSYSDEICFENKEKKVWLSENYIPIFDEKQRPYKVLNIGIDITENRIQAEELIDKVNRLKAQEEILLKTLETLKKAKEEVDENHQKLQEQEDLLRVNMKEMKRVHFEMAQKDAEMKSIINAINQIAYMVEFSFDETIIKVNDKVAKLLSKDKEAFVGEKLSEIESYNTPSKETWNKLKKGSSQNLERRIIINGEKYWFSDNFSPIIDGDKNVRKILMISTEITKSRKQIEKLKRQEAIILKAITKYRKVQKDRDNFLKEKNIQEVVLKEYIEEMKITYDKLKNKDNEIVILNNAINFAFCVSELDTNANFIKVNRNFCNKLNKKENEILGKKYSDFIYEKNKIDFFEEKLKNLEPFKQEVKFDMKDEKVWFEQNYFPIIDNEEKLKKVLIISYDISISKSDVLKN